MKKYFDIRFSYYELILPYEALQMCYKAPKYFNLLFFQIFRVEDLKSAAIADLDLAFLRDHPSREIIEGRERNEVCPFLRQVSTEISLELIHTVFCHTDGIDALIIERFAAKSDIFHSAALLGVPLKVGDQLEAAAVLERSVHYGAIGL